MVPFSDFSFVYFIVNNVICLSGKSRTEPLLSRIERIGGDDASYNIRKSKEKKSLVKVQISCYCHENLCSARV